MKNILCFLWALAAFSCSPKEESISPDSIYNVTSSWEKQDGSNVTFSDFNGKVVVTAMIFTSCKTACPRLTAEMSTISKLVGNVNPQDVQYVLISIDPENDRPPIMKAYLDANKLKVQQWTFIRGSEENTRALANVMAVKYKEISPMEFSHSNIISVYSRKGVLAFQKQGLSADTQMTANAIKQQIEL